MQTWICRILTVVFFLNTLPADAWAAKKQRHKLDQAKTEKVVEEKVEEAEETGEAKTYDEVDYWRDYVRAVSKELENKEWNYEERTYLEIELKNAQEQYKLIKQLADECTTPDCGHRIGAKMQKIDDKYKALQLPLEKEMSRRELYYRARSAAYIGVGVILLHQRAESKKKITDDSREVQAEMYKKMKVANNPAPVDNTYVAPKMPQRQIIKQEEISSNDAFLKQLANNEISYEDIIEYIDPTIKEYKTASDTSVYSADRQTTLDAVRFLSSIFLSYNAETTPLGKDEKENVTWMGKRIKMRALHQLRHVEKEGMGRNLDLRGSLLTLYALADNFLKKYDQKEEALAELDRKDVKEGMYEVIDDEITAALPEYNKWMTGLGFSVKTMVADIESQMNQVNDLKSPALDALRSGISALTTYYLYDADGKNLNALLYIFNKDGKKFHGEHEPFVTEFFGTLADSLVDMPSTQEQQKAVKNLIYNAVKHNNAINVRVQALALASVLNQAERGTLKRGSADKDAIHTLKYGYFSDIEFRKEMSYQVAEIYSTTTEWHGPYDKSVGGNVVKETYGIDVGKVTSKYPWWDVRYFWDAHIEDSLQKFTNNLAEIFESFLPLPEPVIKYTKTTEGTYRGCWEARSIPNPNARETLNSLTQGALSNKLRSASTVKGVTPTIHPVDEDGNAVEHIWCQTDALGAMDNKVVIGYRTEDPDNGQNMRVIGMRLNNPPNHFTTVKGYIIDAAIEVLTWWAWGKALKLLGCLWKLGRTFVIAARASARAAKGMRLARFNGKFSQILKYYGEGWKTQAGILEVSGRSLNPLKHKYTVTLERGGKLAQFEVDLGARSIRSLAGRIQLRIEARRQLLRIAAAEKTGQSIATTSVKQTTAKAVVDTATGKVIIQEPEHFAGKATADEMGKEGAKLITDDANFNVKKWIGDLTPEEQAAFKEFKRTYDAVVRTYGKRTIFGRYNSARAKTVKIKTPQGTVKEVHFAAKDGIFIDPKIGLPSHAYGTARYAAPADQLPFLYNSLTRDIMAGRIPTQGGSFAYHYLGQLPGVSYTMGTVKFAAFLQVADPLSYDIMNAWEDYKYDNYVKQFKIREMTPDEEAKVKEEIQNNILKRIQSMENVDKRGATISAAFMFFNEALDKGLNYIGADGVIQFRRDMYEVVDQVIEKLDKPFKKLTGEEREWFPYPAQVALVNILLATDPTTPKNQEVKPYQGMRHSQDYQDAISARSIKQFQDSITKQIAESKQALNDYMKGDLTADFIKALPGTKANLNTLFEQYAKTLRAISQQVGQISPTASQAQQDKALENAKKEMDKASQKYLKDRGELMAAAIERYMFNDKQATLKAQKGLFEHDFNVGIKVENSLINRDDDNTEEAIESVIARGGKAPTFFDIKDYDELKEKLDEYYAQSQALYIQLHKLPATAFNKSEEEVDTLANEINAKIAAADEEVRANIDKIAERCSGRKLKYEIALEIKDRTQMVDGEEDDLIQSSLEAYKQNVWNIAFIDMLPKAEESITDLYNAYIKDLNNASKKAVKNPQGAQQMVNNARHTFFTQKKALMQQGVKNYITEERQETEATFVGLPEAQLNELKKLNDDHWQKVETLWMRYYELYHQTEVLLYTTAQSEAELAAIEQAVQNNEEEMKGTKNTYASLARSFKTSVKAVLRPLQPAY